MDVEAPPLLTALAAQAEAGPPSVSVLAQFLGYADDYVWFCGLVQLLLPDEAADILFSPTVDARVYQFESMVSERYFPLCDWVIEWYLHESDEEPVWPMLRRGIPFEVFGIEHEGLHELWNGFQPGLCALMLLPVPPSTYWDDEGGMRVAWLDAAADHIPEEVLRKIPEGGIPRGDLTDAVQGTRFEGASSAASWMYADSGNLFFDVSFHDEGFGSFYVPWTEDVIAATAQEWQEAKSMLDAMHDLTTWLEEDLSTRFTEMMDFLLARLVQPLPDEDGGADEINAEERYDP